MTGPLPRAGRLLLLLLTGFACASAAEHPGMEEGGSAHDRYDPGGIVGASSHIVRSRLTTEPGDDAEPRSLPASRGGQDLIGRPMPPLDFDRRLRADASPAKPRVTLYRWWTDGCTFCEKSLPAVESLRRKYGDRGLRVVAVYHPKPKRHVEDAFVVHAAERFGYAGELAVDEDWSELARAYLSMGKRQATSVAFVVDAEGIIRFVHPVMQFFPSDDPAHAQEDADFRSLERAITKRVRPLNPRQ